MVNIETHNKTINKQQDTSTYSADDFDTLRKEFDQIDPGSINESCNAWSSFAGQVGHIADSLKKLAGTPLAEAWESKTSPDAQQQLARAQATAAALADQGMHMARAMDWAHQYAQWYKDNIPGPGYITTQGDTNDLNKYRVRLLDRYNEVIVNSIPDSVQSSLVANETPTNHGADEFKTKPGGPGPGPGASPTGPGPGVPPTTTTTIPNTPTFPVDPTQNNPTSNPTTTTDSLPQDPWTNPSGTSGNPYSPGSYDSSTGGAPTLDTGSSLAGAGGGGAFGGGGGGLGAGGAGGLDPSGAGAGAGGGAAGGLGSAGGGTGGGSAGVVAGGPGGGAAGAGAGRAGMMPMHGGGQNGDDERERGTWLTEDDDVWGGSDAPPGVIGG